MRFRIFRMEVGDMVGEPEKEIKVAWTLLQLLVTKR